MEFKIAITENGEILNNNRFFISLIKGQTAKITFKLYKDAAFSVPWNLTGFSKRFAGKFKTSDSSFVFDFIDENPGWITTDIATGRLSLTIAANSFSEPFSSVCQLMLSKENTVLKTNFMFIDVRQPII